VVSLLAAMVILFLGVSASIPLWREKAAQYRILHQLREERQAEQNRSRQLEAAIISVKSDPAVVERLAREKFGLARPGEVIFKFRSDLTAAPQLPTLPAPSASAAGRSPARR